MRLPASTLLAHLGALLLCLGAAELGAAELRTCQDDLSWEDRVTLHIEETAARATFEANNPTLAPVTVHLEILETVNVRARPITPVVRVIPPGERLRLLHLERNDPGAPWSYRHAWRATLGDPEARHDDDVLYAHPFDASVPRLVTAGPGGVFTHAGGGAWAYDFEMPIGTPVHAARGGLVVDVVDCHRLGGPARWLLERGNRVLLQHEDGTFGLYHHLRQGHVFVEEGARVERGDLLAQSGQTGWAPWAHLHFHVFRAGEDARPVGIRIRFDDGTPDGYEPVMDLYAPPPIYDPVTSSPLEASPSR